MTPSEIQPILERLATFEAHQANQVHLAEETRTAVGQLVQDMAQVMTRLQAQDPRCASHSRRLRELETNLSDIPRRVQSLEGTVGKQVTLGVLVSSVTTGLLLGLKWLTTLGGKP